MYNKQATDKSRRDFLKNSSIAAVSISATKSVFAKEENLQNVTCGIKDADEPKYMPVPKQVDVFEGVLALSGGAGLYYWDTGGSGPVIVLSHPGRGSALTWPYQQPVLSKAGFRVIAYSRRGYFRSPAGSKEDRGNYADDLNALMMHLKVDKFHLLGLAAGGFAVSDFAVSYPEKLQSMIIVCSLFGLWDKEIDKRSDFILSEGFDKMPPEFKELGPAYRWTHPQGVKEWISMAEKSRSNKVFHGQGAKNKITWGKIRAANKPTLFIAGGADLYQPPSMMRAAAREIPNSETLVLPEAGHAVQWEQPALFNRVIIEYLIKHS